MTILVDLPAFSILFLVDLMPLGSGQMAVVSARILTFLVINPSILGVELLRLGPIQLVMPDALVDSTVLISEAVVDVHAALVIALPLVFGMPSSSQHKAGDS